LNEFIFAFTSIKVKKFDVNLIRIKDNEKQIYQVLKLHIMILKKSNLTPLNIFVQVLSLMVVVYLSWEKS